MENNEFVEKMYAMYEGVDKKKPLLVDFWAVWCNPCRAMMNVIEKLKSEGTQVLKIDADEHFELASEMRIMSVPTFFVIEDGEVTCKFSGAQTEAEILAKMANNSKKG